MALHKAIVDLDDYTESMNILVYGNSGVGKTVLAGTSPRALILAAEPGTISAKRQGSKAKTWQIHSWRDFEEAHDWIENNPDAFDWVWIDSITKVQQLCIRHILDEAVAKKPDRDEDIPTLQDHYKWQLMMKRFVTLFNALPVNVGWTAQAMQKTDPEGDDIMLPLITGKDYEISASICADMDVVAYMDVTSTKRKSKNGEVVKVPKRRILVQSQGAFFAKDRYNVVGDEGGYLIDPTMPKIIERVNGSGGVRSTAPARKATKATKTAPTRRAPARRSSK